MNRIVPLIILILLFFSCEKDEINYGILSCTDKKLQKILHNDNLLMEFFYDNLRRLSQVNIYNADTITRIENYIYNNQNQVIERIYGDFNELYDYKNGLLIRKRGFYKNNPDWKPKEVYTYNDKKQIIKADRYFNEEYNGYIEYKYDNKGNTIERREYYKDNDNSYRLDSEFKFSYDDKTNPLFLLCFYPIDIIQKNNVIYSFHYMAVSSLYPTEYESLYIYDNEGFPTEELRYYKHRNFDSIPDKYSFIYYDIE